MSCVPSPLHTTHVQPPSEKVESTVKDKTPGAQLRVLLWLGPDEEGEHWLDDLSLKDNVGKKIGTYAELVGFLADAMPVCLACT